MRKPTETITALLFLLFLVTLLVILLANNPVGRVVEIEKASVKDSVLLDAATRFPNADKVDIINVIRRNSSKVLVVRVTYDYNSTCPKRYHVYYTYPEGKFLPEHPVKASIGCDECKRGACKLTYEEDAIIASTSLPGTEAVRAFVERNKPSVKVERKGLDWEVIWYNDEKAYDVYIPEENGTYSTAIVNVLPSAEKG